MANLAENTQPMSPDRPQAPSDDAQSTMDLCSMMPGLYLTISGIPGPKTIIPAGSVGSTLIVNGQEANVVTQRDRSHSRRRSRSPRRDRRRSYDSRSRSRSRDDYRRPERRSRSPINGAAGGAGYSSAAYPTDRGAGGAPPARSFEDRSGNKDQMMQNVRDSSQQDRRVYVGNLSYDVKWHHLKDFMRQGKFTSVSFLGVH